MLHTGPWSLFTHPPPQLLLAPTSDEMPNVVKEQRMPKKKKQHQNDTKFIHNRPNKHPASCSVISIHLHTTLLCPQMIRLCVFSLGSCGWMRVICNFVHTSLNAVADYLNSIFFFCIWLNILSPLLASGIPLHSHYGCLHIPMAVCWKVPIWAICCQSHKKLGLRWEGSRCTFPLFHEATTVCSGGKKR